jgi:dihydroflavonol-4-reductase
VPPQGPDDRREAGGAPVLVTGATGFVGGLVAARLLADGRRVRALVRRPGDARRLSPWGPGGAPPGAAGPAPGGGRHEPAVGDLDDAESLLRAADGCEVAYHVAGLNTLCLRDPAPLWRVNVDGTRRLLDAARRAGLRRVVFTSSAGVLGGDGTQPADESSPPPAEFTSVYARTKYEAERLALGIDGIEVVAVNPSSVQGPGRRAGTARLLLDYLNGRLPFDVPARFGLCYTADCAEGHLLAEAKGRPGQRYVLNSGTLTSREAIEMVARITGLTERPRTLPLPVAMAVGAAAEQLARVRGRTPRFCREAIRTIAHPHLYDGSRAERELGVRYTPLTEALERMVGWYLRAGLVHRPLPRRS